MNILIAGKSPVNDILKEQLSEEGFIPVVIEDTTGIKSITGEKGLFIINTAGGMLEAGYIIVTREVDGGAREPSGNGRAFPHTPLSAMDKAGIIHDYGMPVALLLDYPRESPSFMTRIALRHAIRLTRKQKKVVYMSRFMRTSGADLESLSREARNLGVTFIKYNGISVDYNQDSGIFSLSMSDGFDSVNIKSAVLISAQRSEPDAEMIRLSRLFKLKLDENRFINGDNYFLYPVLTSRKGIYVFNSLPGQFEEKELIEKARFTVNAIKNELNGTQTEKYANINDTRCAFCYTCYRACPHAAMIPDRENPVMKNLKEACFGCGICASVCPANAIDIASDVRTAESGDMVSGYRTAESGDMASGYRAAESGSMASGYRTAESGGMASGYRTEESGGMASGTGAAKYTGIAPGTGDSANAAIKPKAPGQVEPEVAGNSEIPEQPGTARIKVYCCENSGEVAVKRYLKELGVDSSNIDISSSVCGGDIGAAELISALGGFDKVLVAVCMDNACRHFEGNKRAFLQAGRAKEMLEAAGMDAGRIECIKLSAAMPFVLNEYFTDNL